MPTCARKASAAHWRGCCPDPPPRLGRKALGWTERIVSFPAQALGLFSASESWVLPVVFSLHLALLPVSLFSSISPGVSESEPVSWHGSVGLWSLSQDFSGGVFSCCGMFLSVGISLVPISPSTCCHILSRILGEGQGWSQGLDRSATLKVKAGWGGRLPSSFSGEYVASGIGLIINLFKGIPFGIR